jgi:hypothetical protein
MTNNQERIWDVLIEDAMREGGVSQPPQPAGENTRRLLTPVGAPGVDRGRSLRGPSGRKWAPVVITVALLVMVAAILYAGIVYLPQIAENREPTDQPKAAEGTPSPPRERRVDHPAPTPSPEPQPENTQPADSGETLPDDSGTPEPKPDNPVEQPKPTPEPKPDDTVEQPKPEPKPDDTVEQPKKPNDTVEEPKQPEGTTPEPDSKLRIHMLTEFDWEKSGKSQVLYSTDGETWMSTRYLNAFDADTWFRSSTIADFEAGGVFLRLDGEARFKLTDGRLELELKDDRLYFDNRGALRPISMTVGSHNLTCGSGDASVLESAGSSIRVYDGEVRVGDQTISAGQHGELKKSGFVASHTPLKAREDDRFISDIAERVIYRETFEADPKGRLREGTLEDGVIKGGTVFWGYPENVLHHAGMVMRLRVRIIDATGATITQFSEPRNDNFSYELAADRIKAGEWQTLELLLDEFLERTSHKSHAEEWDSYQNISIQLKGENAQVELDWVELIRAVK